MAKKDLRLEWRRGACWLGQIMVAETTGWGSEDGVRWRLTGGQWSDEFAEPKDLQTACETGVREALTKAGV